MMTIYRKQHAFHAAALQECNVGCGAVNVKLMDYNRISLLCCCIRWLKIFLYYSKYLSDFVLISEIVWKLLLSLDVVIAVLSVKQKFNLFLLLLKLKVGDLI